MDRYQNIGAVGETVHAEMERPERIADLSDVAGDEQEIAATTSVEELLDILAELSERVTRLERAMVMMLAENRAEALSESPPATSTDSYTVVETAISPPQPTRAFVAPPKPAADPLSATRVDFDLPSHQWGAEGLTEKSRDLGPLTPIQHSDYPEIKAPEEEKVAPRRIGPPERVIVRAALEGYPHIVESVCLMWGGREADAYLSRLVIDKRGGRKGFPQDVMDELLILAEVSTIKSGLKPDFTPFDRDRTREREQ
jgi:hypothetical protein